MKRYSLYLVLVALFTSSCLDKLAESPEEDSPPPEEAESAEREGPGDPAETASSTGAGSESENNDRSFTEIRAEKKELEKRLKDLKELAASEGDLIAEEVKATGEAAAIRAYHEEVTQLHGELTRAVEAWKDASRDSFVGVELPEITTSDGRTFSSVVIRKITDESLQIEHSGGNETIEVIHLPVALRKNILHEATVLATREDGSP